jgi:formate-dependent nitrite reductase membrane component NrfD
MKKLLSALVIVVLLTGVAVTAASAQFTTTTSFQVQNLSSSATANIQILFYDSTGNVVSGATINDTITASQSKLYYQGTTVGLPSPFNGSVVISSDQPVAAIGVTKTANAAGTQQYQGTYSGFSAGADKFYAPVVMKAFYGYTTEISVQNAGSANCDVTITYLVGGYTDTYTGLKPGQVHRFDNASTPSMPSGFIGSGTISASAGGSIIAVVNQNYAAGLQQQTYNGFAATDAGTTLYTPVVMKTFYGFNTSVSVQNIDDATSATVTIYFSNGTSQTTPTPLAPKAGYVFTQGNNAALPSSWLGSARLVSSSSAKIIAVVNQQNTTSGKASSYNAMANPSTRYVGPNVMKGFYGFNTSVQIMNVGAAASTFTATFSNGTSQTSTSRNQYETYLFTQGNNASLPSSWTGSVVITSASGTQQFVVIVNQEGPNGVGDTGMSYNAIPSP